MTMVDTKAVNAVTGTASQHTVDVSALLASQNKTKNAILTAEFASMHCKMSMAYSHHQSFITEPLFMGEVGPQTQNLVTH